MKAKKLWQGVPDKLVIALIQPLPALDVTINIPAPVVVTVANLGNNKGVRCTDWEPWSLTPPYSHSASHACPCSLASQA